MLGRAVDLVVQAASAVRGERIIHAKGAAFSGELTLLAGAQQLGVPLVRGPSPRPVPVRFSRGAGLPPGRWNRERRTGVVDGVRLLVLL